MFAGYTDAYLLRCQRYIELNPVRARMVASPEEYAWSSYRCNALGKTDSTLQPHEVYLGLGRQAEERAVAYRGLFGEVLSEQDMDEIRIYLQQQRVWGSPKFQQAIAAQLGCFTEVRPAHRPRKAVLTAAVEK